MIKQILQGIITRRALQKVQKDKKTNIIFKEMNSTDVKSSCENAEKRNIMEELSKEDTEKMHIIENLLKEKEEFKRKLQNEGTIIQNLLVKIMELGEDIRKAEISDLAEKITKIQTEIEKLESENKALRQKTRSEGNEVEDNGEKIMVVLGGRDNKRYKGMAKNEIKDTSHQKDNFRANRYKDGYYNWKESECKIHGNHKAGACRVTCGFCYQRGSHRKEECRKKKQKISELVENKIQKYEVASKATAESDIKEINIQEEDKMESLEQMKEETSQKFIPRDIF